MPCCKLRGIQKNKKEVAYMLNDPLEYRGKMQKLAAILNKKDTKELQKQLRDSDSICGTTKRFPDRTGGSELPMDWREFTRS
jgi:hypothetical protein